MLHKIRNQPKNQPPHGGEMTSKSTNQKTIGINKHGTLLSSQTTEAPGTKHNPQGPHHRSGATFLTYPPNPTREPPSTHFAMDQNELVFR
jgi:hypothetical protein